MPKVDLPDGDEQNLRDRQCEWHRQRERRALSFFGVDFDAPAQCGDFVAHHVHTHTTARDGSDLIGR